MSGVGSLSDLAGRQHGVFTAVQAARRGVSRHAIHRGIVDGRYVVLHRGVYAFGGSPHTRMRSLAAAYMAGGDGAVVSHRAAARLWNLLGDEEDTVEITVPRARSPRLQRVIVHRSTDLVAGHVFRKEGLPVTNPLRTVVDLGAVLPAGDVEDALDRGLARNLFSVTAIEWMRNEVGRPGRNGAGVLGKVLDERALGRVAPDGLLEPRMARLLRDAGLPPAVYHYVITTPDGVFVAEVDFAYPERLLAIEVDGYAVHGTPRAMAKDFVRQNGLVPYRWHVLRFTWHQVVRTPAAVAGTIAEALAALGAA